LLSKEPLKTPSKIHKIRNRVGKYVIPSPMMKSLPFKIQYLIGTPIGDFFFGSLKTPIFK